MTGDNTNPTQDNRQQALQVVRVIWAALLMGQIGFLCAIVVLWNANVSLPTLSDDVLRLLLIVDFGLPIFVVPVGYFLRSQTYKKHWQGPAVTLRGYLMGNLVLLALCEAVAIFGLVVTLMMKTLWPAVIPSVLAMAVQIINFPNGQAMQPSDPGSFSRDSP